MTSKDSNASHIYAYHIAYMRYYENEFVIRLKQGDDQ
jgi:hypothetical protein